MSIFSWIGGLFSKAKDKIKKAWNFLAPVLKEIFEAELGVAVASLKDLALKAIAYVATQGLPTDKDKQAAFGAYMKDALKKEGQEVKQSAIDAALVIWLAYAKNHNLPH